MRYLFTKFRRDLSKMWVQFFAVFMMSVLAITIYSGMEGVWYGLQEQTEEYYEATSLADVWVNGTNITEEMREEIEALENVEKVQESMTVTVSLETEQEDKPDVKLIAMDSLELFVPLIREGEVFDNSSQDGIWLDATFCSERGLAVGDHITLKYGACEKEFVIRGKILSSEYIYYTGSVTDTVPNHSIHGYGMISNEAAELFYGRYLCNELRLQVGENCDYVELQADVEEILGDAYFSISERDDIASVSQITKEIGQMQNMANLFSAVFIILAVLSMYSTMTRLVNTQMIQIGTMKAIGISNSKIRLHYSCYGFFVSLFGGLLGTILGTRLVSNAVMKVKKATLTMPEWRIELSYRSYLIIAMIVLICVAATLFATRKGLRRLPAETMRNTTSANSKTTGGTIEKFAWWKKLEYRTKWMIRDNMQNKVRWLMSIIGVAGSMVLMMAGLGFKDSIHFSNEYVYGTQYSYEYKIVLNNLYTEEEREVLEAVFKGKSQKVYEYNVDIYKDEDGEKERRTISVIDEGDFVTLENVNGNILSLGEHTVAVSSKTANVLGIEAGEKIRCRILGEDTFLELEVTDIVVAPSPQGIFVSRSFWENELEKEFRATSYLLAEKQDYEEACELEIVKEGTSIEGQISSMNTMTKSVMTIIYLMILASLLLGCIIIYNLGMLNYIERFRDYATMKVLGFYQNEVRSIIIRDCMITTILGWLIGIPLGYRFLTIYIGIVQFKTFEWVPTLRIMSLVIASVIVISCSMLVNLFVAHKVTGISMVEALKSVE